MRLGVVVPVPDHRVAAASRAMDALWPAVLAHQGEALRLVEQGGEVDRVHYGHGDRTPRVRRLSLTAWNRHHTRTRRHKPPSPRKPTRAFIITSIPGAIASKSWSTAIFNLPKRRMS